MVREAVKEEALTYLRRAEEFLNSAYMSVEQGWHNVAGFNATQAVINSNDALTVYYLEKRASRDHKEAVRLHIDVVRKINDTTGRDILKHALDQRSLVGYTAKAISKDDAVRLIKSATKFVEWVKRLVSQAEVKSYKPVKR